MPQTPLVPVYLLKWLFLSVVTTLVWPSCAQNVALDTGANKTYPLPAETVHEFPRGTWIENIAIRKNGQILATEETHPRIYQVDPFHNRPAVQVHEFDNTVSVLGIVETSPDVFHVCTGNFSSKLLQGYGEEYIYKVDMRNFSPNRPCSAAVSKLATMDQARAINGMTFLGADSGLLLVSDFLAGVIWNVDIATGDVNLAINSTFTRSTGFGANGIHYHAGYLYFTNSQQETLVKVKVDSKGEAAGNYSVLARGGFVPDDFAVNAAGDSYVTSFDVGSNGIVFVPREDGNSTYVAWMAGPTSCTFGRTAKDRDVLYVATTGGDYNYQTGNKVTVSGKIMKVKVGRSGC